MRRSTLLFVFMTVVVGLGLFQLKYQVEALEKQYRHTRGLLKESEESIHVLKAEWTHLNEPKRLQELTEKHLKIEPIKAAQFVSFKQVMGGAKASYDSKIYDVKGLDDLVAAIAADATLAPAQDD